MTETLPVRVLMVCLGNICRSPMAQGALEAAARDAGLAVVVDSAGTSDWHVGDLPDARSMAAAARRGYDITGQRARGVAVEDFHTFDHILAMDAANLRRLREMRPEGARARVLRLLDLAGGGDVPDPYYDEADAFERALDLIETGVAALLDDLRR
jgi:protein-tyrosine phosphatase